MAGHVTLALYDARHDAATFGSVNEFELTIQRPQLVEVPPGVWHGLAVGGTTPAIILNLPDRPYAYEAPDHWRLPPDTNLIPYSFFDSQSARARDGRVAGLAPREDNARQGRVPWCSESRGSGGRSRAPTALSQRTPSKCTSAVDLPQIRDEDLERGSTSPGAPCRSPFATNGYSVSRYIELGGAFARQAREGLDRLEWVPRRPDD
jgi:hypothetical protein